MKTFNQVVEEEVTKYVEDYAQAITDVGGFGLAKHIKDHLTQAMKKAALAVLQEVHDEIPEAYGWGPEDTEADRGYRICSKNVKAEINRRIATLHGQLTKSKND